MERIVEQCCGLDVGQKTVAACVRITAPDGGRRQVIRMFGTMTEDLLALRDWLAAHGVTQVAMESTGVYWKAVYYVLEDAFTVLLVNAQHMKNVPGRKTDVRDCAWIAELLEHGLLRASFVPPAPIRELRDLTRYRKTQIQERVREVNRLHKVLEDAGVKLAVVASDVLGVSGRAMLEALLRGTTDPEVLAELSRGKLRKKIPELRRALEGHFGTHHRFLVGRILAHLDYLDEAIEECGQQIEELLRPFAEVVERLKTIPGVQQRTAEVIVAEIGVDMSRFPTAAHLASWAGMCPGNNESAGKRKSGRTRKGNKWLRMALIESGQAAARTIDTALSARHRRIMRHRGYQRAVVAVGHEILVISHTLIARATTYQELGPAYFDRRQAERTIRRCVHTLERLGHKVTIEPLAPAA
jgi:transposase